MARASSGDGILITPKTTFANGSYAYKTININDGYIDGMGGCGIRFGQNLATDTLYGDIKIDNVTIKDSWNNAIRTNPKDTTLIHSISISNSLLINNNVAGTNSYANSAIYIQDVNDVSIYNNKIYNDVLTNNGRHPICFYNVRNPRIYF